MIKNRALVTTIGFLLAGTGLLAIIVSLVGLELSILSWIKVLGPVTSFVLKLVMAFAGVVIIYVAQVDWDEEE